LRGVATCFGANVQLVPHEERVAVHWGYESVLVPQITCAKQALRSRGTWKYLVNLVGQDFPLRTNMELVAALKALNGSSLVESVELGNYASRTNNRSLPLGATWYKGSIYGAFRREFLHEAVMGTAVGPIRDLMLKLNYIRHPDEFYFPTLAYNSHLHLPGACLYSPAPESEVGFNYLAKFVIWEGCSINCTTKYVRDVCILGTDHVARLQTVPHLFANKFHADYQPEAYDEMERWYFRRVEAEMKSGSYDRSTFDPTIYAERLCSRYHI
uniref:NAD(P)-dependent oxidoreductase n=1 Tax=Mesocestoides corti TaxID=53468 RepID=A0A5K3FUJ8_MESCO